MAGLCCGLRAAGTPAHPHPQLHPRSYTRSPHVLPCRPLPLRGTTTWTAAIGTDRHLHHDHAASCSRQRAAAGRHGPQPAAGARRAAAPSPSPPSAPASARASGRRSRRRRRRQSAAATARSVRPREERPERRTARRRGRRRIVVVVLLLRRLLLLHTQEADLYKSAQSYESPSMAGGTKLKKAAASTEVSKRKQPDLCGQPPQHAPLHKALGSLRLPSVVSCRKSPGESEVCRGPRRFLRAPGVPVRPSR